MVHYTCEKLSNVVGVSYEYRPIRPTSAMLLKYHFLFYVHYNYCFFVWGNTTSTNHKQMQILQKEVVRIICHTAYGTDTKT